MKKNNTLCSINDIYKQYGILSPKSSIGNYKQSDIDETENYYRVRIRQPNKFNENTFRHVIISEEEGIFSTMGKLKGQKTMTIQSIIFDKEKWDKKSVIEWVNKKDYL
jgi:hypothetical protein